MHEHWSAIYSIFHDERSREWAGKFGLNSATYLLYKRLRDSLTNDMLLKMKHVLKISNFLHIPLRISDESKAPSLPYMQYSWFSACQEIKAYMKDVTKDDPNVDQQELALARKLFPIMTQNGVNDVLAVRSKPSPILLLKSAITQTPNPKP